MSSTPESNSRLWQRYHAKSSAATPATVERCGQMLAVIAEVMELTELACRHGSQADKDLFLASLSIARASVIRFSEQQRSTVGTKRGRSPEVSSPGSQALNPLQQ